MSQLNEYIGLASVGFVVIAALLRWIVLIVRKSDQINELRKDLDEHIKDLNEHIKDCTEYRETLRVELKQDILRIYDKLDGHTGQD